MCVCLSVLFLVFEFTAQNDSHTLKCSLGISNLVWSVMLLFGFISFGLEGRYVFLTWNVLILTQFSFYNSF